MSIGLMYALTAMALLRTIKILTQSARVLHIGLSRHSGTLYAAEPLKVSAFSGSLFGVVTVLLPARHTQARIVTRLRLAWFRDSG